MANVPDYSGLTKLSLRCQQIMGPGEWKHLASSVVKLQDGYNLNSNVMKSLLGCLCAYNEKNSGIAMEAELRLTCTHKS